MGYFCKLEDNYTIEQIVEWMSANCDVFNATEFREALTHAFKLGQRTPKEPQ